MLKSKHLKRVDHFYMRLDQGLIPGLPWEWESVGFPMGIPIWDGNYFKPMGIPTCGFLWVFLWVSVGFLGACLISGTGRVKIPNSRDGIIKFQNVLSWKLGI